MAGRAGEDHLVLEERLEADGAVAASGSDDAELELALGHEVDHGLGVRNGQRHADARVLALELAQEDRDDDRGRPRRGADRDLAGELPLALAGHLVDELLLEGQQPLRASVEAETRLRRLDPAAGAVEQLGAEPLLERPHLQRHGRLRDAEALRRLREALALDDGAECGELARIHKPSLSTACPPRRVLTTS